MSTDNIINNAKNRDEERTIARKSNNLKEAQYLFIKSSSDVGTIRNMGRRGSSFAPKAILSVFTKMSHHNQDKWSEIEISNSALEEKDFDLAQKNYSENLADLLNDHEKKAYIHLGGGHDHAYPLLMSINKKVKKICVINIDAHLDTRQDKFHNSGTPFRQFSNDFQGEFELIQLGIHLYANTISTMEKLTRGNEKIISFNECKTQTSHFQKNTAFFETLIPFDPETTYVFSLDADALSSAIMEGVSAVNHQGLPIEFVSELLEYMQEKLQTKFFGFYEYNPVYDNLSQKGARALCALLYQIINQ